MGQLNFNSQPAPWSLNWLQQFLYSLWRSWWARCSTTAQLWLPQSTTPSTTPHPPPTPLHPPHMPPNLTTLLPTPTVTQKLQRMLLPRPLDIHLHLPISFPSCFPKTHPSPKIPQPTVTEENYGPHVVPVETLPYLFLFIFCPKNPADEPPPRLGPKTELHNIWALVWTARTPQL